MRRSLRGDTPNNVGVRRQVSPRPGGLGRGRPVPFFQVRADDDDARSLNVVLLPAVLSDAPAPHGPCVAELEWGTGGASVTAEIDVGRGTQVQISASYVGLAVRNDGAVDDGSGTSVDPQPGPQDVVALVAGYGSRVAFGKATRTFYFRQVPANPGSDRLVIVPNFAKSVLITRTAPGTTSITVELVDGVPFSTGDPQFTPLGNVRASFSFPAAAVPSSIDLPALTSFVRVRNSGASPITYLQIAFELAL